MLSTSKKTKYFKNTKNNKNTTHILLYHKKSISMLLKPNPFATQIDYNAIT